jgi:hypothetical protein
MDEWYFRLQIGENKEQCGSILRIKDGKLEELTGFYILKKTGETSTGVHYEADTNTDGYGEPRYKNGKHTPRIVGLTMIKGKAEVEIHKQPERGDKKAKIEKITMSRAAKILENLQYIKDAEAYISIS